MTNIDNFTLHVKLELNFELSTKTIKTITLTHRIQPYTESLRSKRVMPTELRTHRNYDEDA